MTLPLSHLLQTPQLALVILLVKGRQLNARQTCRVFLRQTYSTKIIAARDDQSAFATMRGKGSQDTSHHIHRRSLDAVKLCGVIGIVEELLKVIEHQQHRFADRFRRGQKLLQTVAHTFHSRCRRIIDLRYRLGHLSVLIGCRNRLQYLIRRHLAIHHHVMVIGEAPRQAPR